YLHAVCFSYHKDQHALVFAILFFGGAALWFLIVPGVIAGIVYIWAIIDAARFRAYDRRL
ncbi:MAG: hypothetical protein ACTH7Q_13765, partial [Pseudoalteromonas sp.]